MPDFLIQLKLDSLTKIEFVNKIVNAKGLGTYYVFVGELLMLLDPGTTHPFLGAGRAQVQEGAWELRC